MDDIHIAQAVRDTAKKLRLYIQQARDSGLDVWFEDGDMLMFINGEHEDIHISITREF